MFIEENYLMWLTRIEGISLKKKEVLIDYFGSAKDLFNATPNEIEKYCVSKKINFENILKIKDKSILESFINELYKKDIKYLSKYNEQFPNFLKDLEDVPLGLYILGDLPNEDDIKVSIVGSRNCTQYGEQSAYKFAKELALEGMIIVSGMALGIDTIAHKAAIDAGGKTIAILGCGVDIIYPTSNRTLRNNIINNGCLISEFPPMTQAFPSNFPIRNRLISGISDLLIVVEAEKNSGTLITAKQALKQKKDIFAIPGNINNPLSSGTNNLIKEGAFLLTEKEDIIKTLKNYKNPEKYINIQEQKEKNILELLAPDEKLVYDCISELPITFEEVIIKTNLTIQSVQYILLMLELKGYVQKLAGQKYIKKI